MAVAPKNFSLQAGACPVACRNLHDRLAPFSMANLLQAQDVIRGVAEALSVKLIAVTYGFTELMFSEQFLVDMLKGGAISQATTNSPALRCILQVRGGFGMISGRGIGCPPATIQADDRLKMLSQVSFRLAIIDSNSGRPSTLPAPIFLDLNDHIPPGFPADFSQSRGGRTSISFSWRPIRKERS